MTAAASILAMSSVITDGLRSGRDLYELKRISDELADAGAWDFECRRGRAHLKVSGTQRYTLAGQFRVGQRISITCASAADTPNALFVPPGNTVEVDPMVFEFTAGGQAITVERNSDETWSVLAIRNSDNTAYGVINP